MPEDPVIREHLGDIYYAKGETEKAVYQWELSLRFDASNTAIEDKIKRAKEEIKQATGKR